MSRITLNGAQYYVEQAGDGPPLLLLHGFTGAASTWTPHAAAWAREFRTIAVDLLGHGASAAPADAARSAAERRPGDALSSTSPATRAGWAAAKCSATRPPIE